MALIFIAKNGENLGGFELAGVQDGLRSGYFSSDDLAWVEPMPDWKALHEVLAGLATAQSIDDENTSRCSSQKDADESAKHPDTVTYLLKSSPSAAKPAKNAHGQPLKLFRANLENNVSKAIDQLSGICTGILADGVVTDQEATFFREWVRAHAPMEPVWPFTQILTRVEAVFAHGKIEEEEKAELAEIMRSICGGDELASDAIETYSSQLPLDSPMPDIILQGSEFVMTGRFAHGTRAKVAECILSRNGTVKDGFPSADTRYLVIGTFASRDWYNTSYGRKIERAVELRNGGKNIAIISEEHWKKFIL